MGYLREGESGRAAAAGSGKIAAAVGSVIGSGGVVLAAAVEITGSAIGSAGVLGSETVEVGVETAGKEVEFRAANIETEFGCPRHTKPAEHPILKPLIKSVNIFA